MGEKGRFVMREAVYFNRKCTMILVIIILASLFLLTACRPLVDIWNGPILQYGAEGSDLSILVIQDKNGLFGYGDVNGNIIIKPDFLYARPFFDGLAAVKSGQWRYIDIKGNTAIPYQYYQALDFHNGKAIVGTDLKPEGVLSKVKCSIIDTKGNILKETDYDYFGNYSGGVTFAVSDNSAEYLDQNYDVITGLYVGDRIYDFHEGFTFSDVSYKHQTYKDITGKRLPKEYTKAEPFSGGYAAVMPDETAQRWGYIDKAGEIVITPQYMIACGFGEDMACVKTTDRGWIVIDTSGREICSVSDSMDTAKAFSEGLCAVGRSKVDAETYYNTKCEYDWGFIDTSGKLVIDFKYDDVTPFLNGIAQVMVDGKIGYIDKTGKYIWEPK
jgi:hypothetical protein